MKSHLSFYEKFPLGLMTPTHRPETGCRTCRKGLVCREHAYRVMLDMIGVLWEDIIMLMSHVPCREEFGYVRRYEWLLSLLKNRQNQDARRVTRCHARHSQVRILVGLDARKRPHIKARPRPLAATPAPSNRGAHD